MILGEVIKQTAEYRDTENILSHVFLYVGRASAKRLTSRLCITKRLHAMKEPFR